MGKAASLCNISTYVNSLGEKVYIPFDDGGGNLVPAKDGLDLKEDVIQSVVEPYDFRSANRKILLDSDIAVDNDFGDTIIWWDSSLSANPRIQLQTRGLANSNYAQLFIYDDNSLPVINSGVISANISGRHEYKLTYTLATNTYTLFLDGIQIYSAVGMTTNPITINRRAFGARLRTLNLTKMKVYSFVDDLGGIGNCTIRLWPLGDPNAGKIIDSNDNEWIITDNAPNYAVYPNIGLPTGDETGAYLESDTPCGDNDLFIVDDIAPLIDGEFIHII